MKRCIQRTGKKRKRQCMKPGTVTVWLDYEERIPAGKMCAMHAAKLPEE